jgi:BirA family transcriptional regulator, biotin operon repressor / biotin---[acetyl-CoA-carboxylase] ligase
LNVNNGVDDFPASLCDQSTSLHLLTGDRLDRSEVARALIERLDDLYDQGLSAGAYVLCEPWRARFESIGRLVQVQTTSATVSGRLLDADLQSGLTLTSADGPPGLIPTVDVVSLTCADDPLPSV